ncbi:hypothetical protein FIU97_17550 [Roseivivax sp. THAF40]|uniref:hypothetical protein n=1 Tax=unclassified Roseivivax TaxID=2639302 RepID=UPI0012A77D7B|nr:MULTISPECIES: hypothetical protein [unclassified Roseivivax]QFS84567.1 hypothetical protein FIV09_17140 [Roseivivax sp. THAF197b]QFT48394.1 hypothetical protein FIU97_17550 [Roseivivax sp. THAF40]
MRKHILAPALLGPLSICLALATSVAADPPEIRDVSFEKLGMDWRVSVTLAHPDTGWDHYADGWRIETEEGEVIDTRVLHHPHVQEQPFTRSLSSVMVPDGVWTVYVRARCSVDGWSENRVAVKVRPEL